MLMMIKFSLTVTLAVKLIGFYCDCKTATGFNFCSPAHNYPPHCTVRDCTVTGMVTPKLNLTCCNGGVPGMFILFQMSNIIY